MNTTNSYLLEFVRDYGVMTREQLTLLSPLSERGTETALGRLCRDGMLSRSLRLAQHPRAEIGLARKRIVYYLGTKGRAHFGLDTKQRGTLSRKVRDYGAYPERLAHAVGVSDIRLRLELGHIRGLWDHTWHTGKGTGFQTNIGRHIPDGVTTITTFKAFPRLHEFEHKNRTDKSVQHALKYWSLYQGGALNGRVVWWTRSNVKLRHLRAAIQEAFQGVDTGGFFIFIALEDVPPEKPEVLLEPRWLTLSELRAPLVQPNSAGARQVASAAVG